MERLSPYIVYKRKNLQAAHTLRQSPRYCTCYSMSDSEWMEAGNFLEWFHMIFPVVEDIQHTGLVILLLEGHQLHTLLSLIQEAKEKAIVLYGSPPHTTHLLQPLNVVVYGPLKQVWSQVLKLFKLEFMAATVDKAAYPSNAWLPKCGNESPA